MHVTNNYIFDHNVREDRAENVLKLDFCDLQFTCTGTF